MYTKLISLALLICLTSDVNSQECVTYNFEEDFDEFFTNERICDVNSAPWSRGSYEDLGIESPHPQSKTFMEPGETLSCTSSTTFPVRAGGIFEVKAYMESASENDQIIVTVQGLQEEEEDASLGIGVLSAQVDAESDNGFHNFTVTWQVSDDKLYNGYVVFRGVASEQSTVFVDSFRYIPPDVDSESCIAYEDETIPDGPETGGTTTDDPETGGETTDDPGTGGTTTDDPGTGDTTTEDPGTGDTTTEDPGTGDTTTEDPGTGDTTTEDPGTGDTTTKDPETGDTTTEDPGTGDTTTEDPGTGETTTEDPGTGDTTTEDPGTGDTTTEDPGTGDTTTEDPGTGDTTTKDPETGGTTTEDPGTSGTTNNGPEIDGTTTDGPDTDGPSTDGPEEPSTESPDTAGVDPIWKTLTIVFATLLSVIIIGLVCWFFYECGRRRAQKKTPQELFMTDYDNLPKPVTVPRVNKVYNDSVYYRNP